MKRLLDKIVYRLFYNWYFVSYCYTAEDGSTHISNSQIQRRHKVKSIKDINAMIDLIQQTKSGASNVIIISWKRFE